ncbi:hypothetical protein [Staphylococcus hyicus]|uniref:hypothetical protein n=1 Tax=Staphylococcus hyicus TaxID=1284 RepID=UPI0031330BB0
MKGKGFIKLYRDVMYHTVFSDPYLYKLFNYCLLKASDRKHDYLMDNIIIELDTGEFIWGRKVATEELNYKAPPKYKLSEKSWENKLKVLKNANYYP